MMNQQPLMNNGAKSVDDLFRERLAEIQGRPSEQPRNEVREVQISKKPVVSNVSDDSDVEEEKPVVVEQKVPVRRGGGRKITTSGRGRKPRVQVPAENLTTTIVESMNTSD